MMSKKILIVDDEKDITLTLKELFLSKGYEVWVAFTGEEAVELLGLEGLDLILLDIQIPGINGVEILSRIKKGYPHIKTVVLTGFLEEYKNEIEAIGCDSLLSKPFSIKTLISVVESTLAEERDKKERFSRLIEDAKILAKAKLLFIEPNEIMYSSKLVFFSDPKRCLGEYRLAAAFSEKQIMEKVEDFRPDIVLSNISMFRLYKLADRLANALNPPKDIILYGLSAPRDLERTEGTSFVGGFFDPITAVVRPKEMDKLGKIVRATAIAHNLYIKT